MNPILSRAIHAIYMDAADDKGGGGGGLSGDTKVEPAAARTYLADFVDPKSLEGVKDEEVLALHTKVSATVNKHTAAAIEKAKAAGSPDVAALKEKWTKGELKLELPKDSKLDQKDVDEVAAIAREQGLSTEQATGLLAQRNAAATAFESRAVESFKAQRAKWVDEIKADPELGGEKLSETQRLSMLPIEKFMQPELRTALRETGFGDHPMMVRFLVKLGKAMAEDKPGALGGGAGGAGGKKNPEDVLYGAPEGQK